ncbi:hypothetical protein QTP88_005039 [Uroleucon formosanum]
MTRRSGGAIPQPTSLDLSSNKSTVKAARQDKHIKTIDNFNITEEELNQFLGTEIEKESDASIVMHQGLYCKIILEKLNLAEENPVQIPADPQHSLDNKQ